MTSYAKPYESWYRSICVYIYIYISAIINMGYDITHLVLGTVVPIPPQMPTSLGAVAPLTEATVEHDPPPTPNQTRKERQHNSSCIHVPTVWSLPYTLPGQHRRFQESGAPTLTPNSRALTTRTPTKGTSRGPLTAFPGSPAPLA